jgi:hypothetical protein
MQFRDFFFLPDFVLMGLGRATWQGSPLIKETRSLSQQKEPFGIKPTFTPLALILSLLGLSTLLTAVDLRRRKISVVYDFVIYSLAGLIGVLVLWLWFGTAHSATAANYNLLWANPLFLIAAPILLTRWKSSAWFQSLLLAMAVLLGIGLLGVLLIPQSFSSLFSPIMMLLLFRLGARYYLQKQEPA